MGENDVNAAEELNKLRSYLGRTVRIDITDGRTIVGVFVCTDRESNLILREARETISLRIPTKTEGEFEIITEDGYLGTVLVPGHAIQKCYLKKGEVAEQ